MTTTNATMFQNTTEKMPRIHMQEEKKDQLDDEQDDNFIGEYCTYCIRDLVNLFGSLATALGLYLSPFLVRK